MCDFWRVLTRNVGLNLHENVNYEFTFVRNIKLCGALLLEVVAFGRYGGSFVFDLNGHLNLRFTPEAFRLTQPVFSEDYRPMSTQAGVIPRLL